MSVFERRIGGLYSIGSAVAAKMMPSGFVCALVLVCLIDGLSWNTAGHALAGEGYGSHLTDDQQVKPADAEAKLMTRIRQLTFEGRRAGEGYFSQDDSKLIFQAEREPDNPFFQIYVLDLANGDTQRISPGIGKTTCAWFHPKQDKVFFSSTHEDPQAADKQKKEIENRAAGRQKRYAWDYDEHYDVFERDSRTGKLKKLTDARGYDAEASMSPDGRLIVFASNRHAYSAALSPGDAKIFEMDKSYMVDIYLMNADGSNLRRLTDVRGYDGGPFFSPDGRWICWRRFSVDGVTAEIYTMSADGSGERQITRMGAMSWAPYYHPSGEYFIFTTNKHGFDNFELYMIDVEGRSQPVRVTYTPGFDGLPSFSWDGSQVSWTSRRTAAKNSHIFIADWDHDSALRMLGLEGADAARRDSSRAQAIPALPATQPEISAEDARHYVETLASKEMEGRMTGTPGARLATNYVAQAFKRIGLQPAGDDGSFFQEFEFTAGASLGPANEIVLQVDAKQAKTDFQVDRDWRPLAFSKSGQFEPAEVVFAGYGIVAPKSEEYPQYNSFVHLDVKDKWVMLFRYMPEDISAEQRQHFSRYTGLRYKAMVVRDKGAKGLIIVSGPTSKAKEQLIKMRFDATLAGTSIPAICVTDEVASAILQAADTNLEALQTQWDSGDVQMGFVVANVKLGVSVDVQKVTRRGRNVLARLPAGESSKSKGFVLVGAHVDHLGKGRGSGSLARDDEKDEIHYGADDNASGVAGVLEIAEYLAHEQVANKLTLARDIVFAAWSGEELGLLGSSHFAKKLGELTDDPNDISSAVCAYLNMDMIGRLDKKLIVQGLGSSSIWPREIERRNVPVGLSITTQMDSYLPTDATSFYIRGVPILSLFTGAHADYHSPRDTPEKLNYAGLQQVAQFAALITKSLATRADGPDYIATKDTDTRKPRAGLRTYLGTIPDYADADVPGLKLSGVSSGGPAEQAGLQGGDIIVELAGRRIENIYDYMFAMEALKIGDPVKIVVLRDDHRLTRTITPGSRE